MVHQVEVQKKEDKTKSCIEAIASNITLCQLDRVVNCWIIDHLLTLIFPNSSDAFGSKKDSINNKWMWNVANYHLNHDIYIWNFSIKAMFWTSLKTYWQVILLTCPLLTCDMWNVCLSAQPVGMSLSSSASNTNKNWTFCRFFTKAVNWSKFGFDMFCLIVYTHDKKETFQTSP